MVEIEDLRGLLERGESLRNCVLQGLDLRTVELDWSEVDLEETVFLGCRSRDTRIFELLYGLAEERGYEQLLLLTDSPKEAVQFLLDHPPQAVSAG